MFKRNSKVLLTALMLVLVCGTLLSAAYGYDKTYTTYMCGNSHIDTAWQWTTTTTRNTYVPNTFNQAMNLMNANSDYTFNASASLHYKWIKADNPTLYNNIKTKVANGQWNLVGGQYIEPDLNMTSGESLVRQSLFGQRFFNAEFGKKCTVGFVPDVFGFSAQLPQILKKSGMDYFVTTKLNWNDTNGFPYELFKWNALDGSQVIAYKPRSDYSTGVDRNNINYTLDEPNRHSIKKGIVLYGSGDAGGGPDQNQVNSIRTLDADGTMPNVKMYSVNKYFSDLTTTDKNNIVDTQNGEMYLENHRGTYTSQALIKKNNRFGEIAAEEAEKFSSMAQWLGGVTYPQTSINSAWELVLLNQFHDILPGSGTNNQVVEAQNNGQTALNSLNGTINSAMSSVASKIDTTVTSGVPVVVFNPLSFGRKQPVQTNVTFSSAPTSVRVYDSGTGAEVPAQLLSTNGNTATIVFIADSVPSIGTKVFNAVANTGSYTGSTGLTIGSNVITSDLFQVTISGTTGNITSILDKTNNKQVFTGGDGNVLQILDDTPAQWDAWNVDYDDMTRAPLSTMGSTTGISIVESGPVKATYRINKSYGSSTFSQYITLYPGINRVDIRMTANWQESHKMLKVAFPLNVSGATQATYEIAYGAVARSNQRDTSFNQARFEVSAHKWADLSNGGYGVSVLNNCKYGYDTYLNTMRLSLLRSPKSPDGSCDMSSAHEFTYSLYPHTGDWKTANTVYKGYELNYPLIGYATTAHTGSIGKTFSFMSVNAGNVILSAVKKAEDTSDYIIRMYESQGSSASPTVTLAGNITSISETNLLEENTGTPSYSGNTFSTSLGAYVIKTFKVNIGAAGPTPTPGGPTATPTPTPTPGATATPTPTPLQVSLTSYYNQDGFSYDTNRANGAYDPGASTTSNYSADLLTSNPSFGGVPYTLGPKTDSSNNEIKGTGQTITLTQGQYSSVRFLGSATNGDQTGTFRINYTDATYTDVSVTEKDWCTSSTSGQNVVQTMAHRHNGTADQTLNTYVFAYYLTPTAGKTVASLVIPNNANIHVLAITLVY
jgi:alpha-mannosidase